MILAQWKTNCQIRFLDNWFNRRKAPAVTILAKCSHRDCGVSYQLTMEQIPQSSDNAIFKIVQTGDNLPGPHACMQVRGKMRKEVATALINKALTEYHYELVSQSSKLRPYPLVLKKIKSESKLASRNSPDVWEDLRLETSKGERYIQFRGESPLTRRNAFVC